MNNPIDHLSGTNIKGYELLERIGAGGFGAVYRAVQSTIHREVAIKIILPGWANNSEFIRRFETEAQVIAQLEHPHIVPLYDYWRDATGAYMVMRYLRGGSVQDALRDGPYELEAASRLLDQIASALALAHRSGIVHRDIKPGNILLDEDCNAYMSDFGIAKDLSGSYGVHTAPDAVMGSLDYISPEQARGEPITGQTDIYSLGVTLFEMIAGQHPFKDASTVEKLFHHINDPLPQIEGLRPEHCDAINSIIQTATAKAPAKRYPDVLALAVAFREAVGRDSTQHELQVIEQLTLREHDVIRLIVEGRSNQEIASKLFVTVATVRWHIRQLYKKLGVRSRVQAIVRARELDLIVTDTAREASPSGAVIISLSEPENPYKGLRPFQVADSLDFFGREAAVARLIERMGDGHRFSRFLAVVGPSGSGKSSLVRAGLIPALWQGKLAGSERWFFVDMIPGTRPIDQLEVALTRVAANPVSNLQEQLMRDANGLLRTADLILPQDNTQLVLVIDQFEELFTLAKDETLQSHFLNLLYAAVVDPRSRLRIIITLRADYFDRPLHYPEFGELIRTRTETVLPLNAQGLEQAIVGPAQRVGLTFEAGLVATMVSDMHYQVGALPLLQYALTELFDRREGRVLTRAAYEQMGGAAGALANRADEIYHSLDDKGRELTCQMFLRLVTLGERTGDTRRRALRSELLTLQESPDLMEEIIDLFTDYRLLSLDHEQDTRRPVVELAHEAILREWGRLRDWLEQSQHDIRQQTLLAAAATEWANAGHETSYLLRGARLKQMEAWARETTLALNRKEREFLESSLIQQADEEESERTRHVLELELVRQSERAQRRAAQNLRYLAAALLVFLIAALVLSLFAFSQQQAAETARATSNINAVIALNNAAQAQELALVNGSQAALAQNNVELALALAAAANRGGQPSAQAQRILSEAVYRPGPVHIMEGMESNAMSIAFSPDGHIALAGGISNSAYVWDVASGNLIHRLEGHTDWIIDVGISADNRTGFSFSRDRSIILWDLETGQEIRRFGADRILGPEALSATFTPDGRYILSNNGALPGVNPEETAELILWDISTGAVARTFRGHTTGIGGIAISPDGTKALSGGYIGDMILWDMETAEVLQRFSENSTDWRKMPSDIAFESNGRLAFVQGMDGIVAVWDLEQFALVAHLGRGYSNGNWAWDQVALSPDGRWIAAYHGERGRGLWDTATGKIITVLPDAGRGAAFSPDGRYLLIDGTSSLMLWDATNGAEMQHFQTMFPVMGMALSPDGRTLFVAAANIMNSDDRRCEFVLFETASARILKEFELTADEVDGLGCVLWAAPIFTDGHRVFTGVDERVILWDVMTGERLQTFSGHSASITDIDVSPDGRLALSGDLNGQFLLWDIASGQEIALSNEIRLNRSNFVFTGEGLNAVSSGIDGQITLWDLANGTKVRDFDGVEGKVATLQVSPDGRTALACGDNGQVTLLDLASGQTLRNLMISGGCLPPLWTHDGRYLVTSSGTLWELETGEVVRQYPQGWIGTLSLDDHSFFSAQSRTLLSEIVQYRIDMPDALLTWALDNRYVRELDCNERVLYQLELGCDAAGTYPTRTPYPILAATAVVLTPAAPTAIPMIVVPMASPHPIQTAIRGENRGEVVLGDYQVWLYEGRAGEKLTIEVRADIPANGIASPVAGVLDTLVIVTAPDGRDLNIYNSGGGMVYAPPQSDDIETGSNTDSLVEGLVLPVDGDYQIIVSGSGYRTGGAYTMLLEAQPPG